MAVNPRRVSRVAARERRAALALAARRRPRPPAALALALAAHEDAPRLDYSRETQQGHVTVSATSQMCCHVIKLNCHHWSCFCHVMLLPR